MLKLCKCCGEEKDFDGGQKKDSKASGFMGLVCWVCWLEAQRKHRATEEGREAANAASRKRRSTPEGRDAQRESGREASRKRRATPEGKESTRESGREASRKRRENGKYQEYLDTYPLAKMRRGLSNLVHSSMRVKGWRKTTKTQALLGCSFQEFKSHIEEQFTEGMSWENYGEWHFDHRIPCACANTQQELEALFHYSNFQPMWGSENISKGSKLPDGWLLEMKLLGKPESS